MQQFSQTVLCSLTQFQARPDLQLVWLSQGKRFCIPYSQIKGLQATKTQGSTTKYHSVLPQIYCAH